MGITQEVNEIREQILCVFPKSLPPTMEELTIHTDCCEENSREIVKGFLGKNWWEVSKEAVELNFGNLGILEDGAFHYYFPSYLLAALDLPPSSEVLDFLLSNLSPFIGPHNSRNTLLEKRSRLFSFEQAKVIIRFLELVLKFENSVMINWRKDAEAALKFWRNVVDSTLSEQKI